MINYKKLRTTSKLSNSFIKLQRQISQTHLEKNWLIAHQMSNVLYSTYEKVVIFLDVLFVHWIDWYIDLFWFWFISYYLLISLIKNFLPFYCFLLYMFELLIAGKSGKTETIKRRSNTFPTTRYIRLPVLQFNGWIT